MTGRFLTASTGGKTVCFDVSQVDEVVECSILRNLPNLKTHVSGITNVKGTTLPVFHLYKKTEAPFKGIVFNISGKKAVLSIDDVTEIIDITIPENFETISPVIESAGGRLFVRSKSMLEEII